MNPSNPCERRENAQKKTRKFLATKKKKTTRNPQKQGKEDQGSCDLSLRISISGRLKREVTESGVSAYACQQIVSQRPWTGNRTVTQMLHPLLKDNQIARDNRLPVQCRCLRSLRHRTVIPVATHCLFTPCLNMPNHGQAIAISFCKRDPKSRLFCGLCGGMRPVASSRLPLQTAPARFLV